MKNALIAVAGMVALVCIPGVARATEFTFVPNDGSGNTADIWDLDHYKFYTWGFKEFSLPEGEYISAAQLSIHNINNWTSTENGSPGNPKNWLYIHLLDSVENASVSGSESGLTPAGKLKVYTDDQNGGDSIATFASVRGYDEKLIDVYSDYSGGANGDVVDLVYNFDADLISALSAYIANGGNFGFGFDPDCHYWNDGVKFTITTSSRVPDGGATALMLGGAIMVLAGLRRQRQA